MKQDRKHPGRRAAFTLVELSIVLIVIGLVLGGIMGMLSQNVRRVKTAELSTKLDAIETALLDFRRVNNRVPCPADATTAITSVNFGIEAATPGTCTGGTPAANFTDGSNTVGGVVPVRTLGLPDDDMFDPWGGRLTYAVDARATQNSPAAFSTYDPTSTTIGSIIVNDGSGNPRTSNAIIAIVSHGPNGHGAFQLSGVRKSSGSTNPDELKNCHCKSNGTNDTFTSTFVEEPATGASSDILNNYDDIVRYYLRSQLLSYAEQFTR